MFSILSALVGQSESILRDRWEVLPDDELFGLVLSTAKNISKEFQKSQKEIGELRMKLDTYAQLSLFRN
jgi:hypothetical protein